MCDHDFFNVGDRVKYVDEDGNCFYGEVVDSCVQVNTHSLNRAVVVKVSWRTFTYDPFPSSSIGGLDEDGNVVFFPSAFRSQNQLCAVSNGEWAVVETMET